MSQEVAHPFRAKIVRLRTTLEKSPASRERDAESADLDPDRADLVAVVAVGVAEGQKRGTAYSKAAVRAIELGRNDNALLAEGVSSTDVRWTRPESNSRPRPGVARTRCPVVPRQMMYSASSVASARLFGGAWIMPAATVWLVASSTRMNEPVWRFMA